MKKKVLDCLTFAFFAFCIMFLVSCNSDVIIEIPKTKVKTEVKGNLDDFRAYSPGDTLYVWGYTQYDGSVKYKVDHNPMYKDTVVYTDTGSALHYYQAIIRQN